MLACTDESVQIFCFSISMKNYCWRKCLSLVHHSFRAFAFYQEELVINGAPSLKKLPHCWRAFDPPKRRKAGELLPSSLHLLFSTAGAGRLLSHLYLSRHGGLPSCMNVTNVPENKAKPKKNWFVCLFFTFFFSFLSPRKNTIHLFINKY